MSVDGMWPLMEEPELTEQVDWLLKGAEECGGLELAKPDWPEGEEVVKRFPDKVSLGAARGPDKAFRRLAWIGG